METSRDTQLPDFKVERFHIMGDPGSYDMLQIGCPRCGGEFWVRGSWVRIDPVLGRADDPPAFPFGRQCPYCPKTSAIPERLRYISLTDIQAKLMDEIAPEYTLDRRLSGPVEIR